MIQVNRIYLIFNRLVTKKFLVDTSDIIYLYTQDFAVKASVGIGIYVISLLIVAFISLGTLFWQIHKAAKINPAEVIKAE